MDSGALAHLDWAPSVNKAPVLSFWDRHRLPVLLQAEAAECGLACLCMVSSYWGFKTDAASMRQKFSVSIKGVSLGGLMKMASGMSLQPRPLKLDIATLEQLKLPCVLHWDLDHFVVLKRIDRGHMVIHDPAIGEQRLSKASFGEHFTGIAVELTPTSEFAQADETQKFTLFSLMGRVTGLKRGLTQILLLGLALQVCALIAPFYMQWVIDQAILAADRSLVTVLAVGFSILVLIQTAITGIRAWLSTVLATNLNFQWLGNVFGHLMKLPIAYFEKRHTGDIVSRFSAIQTMQKTMTTQFVEGLIDGVMAVGTLIMMFLYSPLMAGISCLAISIYAFARWIYFRPLRDATSEQLVYAAKQQTHFLESIRSVQSVRLFNRTEQRRSAWTNLLADQFNADVSLARISVSFHTFNFFLTNAERVIVIWLAALIVLDNKFSVGMLFAYLSYKDQFTQRMAGLVDKFFEFKMLRVHGSRLADIVLTPIEQDGSEIEFDPQSISPSIEVRNLSFRYADSEPYLFENFNLTIPAGQCIAITGASGCGKTTLVKIILGLLKPTSGEVLIGGVGLGSLGLTNYRQMLGTVMQEDGLFSGSISENISFFEPGSNQARIVDCARMASIHQDICNMPMGYSTIIGDIGSGLSGGQKQRVLMARALFKDPKILFMDEATSELDVGNEMAVNQSIQSLKLTRVIVAHRPDTIAMADRVVTIRGGTIAVDCDRQNHMSRAPSAITELKHV